MGYDLHITKAQHWTDSEASPISDDEWRVVVAGYSDFEFTKAAEVVSPGGTLRYENPGLVVWNGHPNEVTVWFDFRHGRVVVKNPDEATIARMIAVAGRLGARVIGDDGEMYESPGVPPTAASLSLSARIASWFARYKPTRVPNPPLPPFGVGDRVRDTGGRQATVLAIDARAMHGFGSIKVRFDDGRELDYAMFAHNLTPLDKHDA